MILKGNSGETDIENRLMDMGRGEEKELYGKSNMETYITICKIDIQWEFVVWQKPTQHCKVIFFQLKNKQTTTIKKHKQTKKSYHMIPKFHSWLYS